MTLAGVAPAMVPRCSAESSPPPRRSSRMSVASHQLGCGKQTVSRVADQLTDGSLETYLALRHESIGFVLTWTSLVPKAAASCVYVNDMMATT